MSRDLIPAESRPSRCRLGDNPRAQALHRSSIYRTGLGGGPGGFGAGPGRRRFLWLPAHNNAEPLSQSSPPARHSAPPALLSLLAHTAASAPTPLRHVHRAHRSLYSPTPGLPQGR